MWTVNVESEHHACPLATARLDLISLEVHEGRWRGIPREEYFCKLGCRVVGDVGDFLSECAALTSCSIRSLERYSKEADVADSSLTFWRRRARELECRWRERVHSVRECQTEAENQRRSGKRGGGQHRERCPGCAAEEKSRQHTRPTKASGRNAGNPGTCFFLVPRKKAPCLHKDV